MRSKRSANSGLTFPFFFLILIYFVLTKDQPNSMEFEVQSRSLKGKSINRKLRISGQNSGVVYGLKDPIMVSMPSNKALKLIKDTHGSHSALDLLIKSEDGSVDKRKVIIQDYQMSPFKPVVYHIDFREVDDNSVLKITIPIHIVGISKAVKLGGTMQVIRHEIPVRCKAKDIPERIDVDVTELDFGGSIHVLDIPYPEGVRPIVSGRNFTLITLAGRQKAEAAEEETTAEETTA